MPYQGLNIEERITFQLGQFQALSQRAIARKPDLIPSIISRELRCPPGGGALLG